MTTTDLQAVVDDFNAAHGSRAWVRYWTGTRDDAPKYGLTVGKAWLLGEHTPVVRVEGAASCIALTHVDPIPDQPDGIEFDSPDLPDPVRAIERVREYIGAFGDGIYNVIDGHPLYARDVEALRQAAIKVAELTAELAKQTDLKERYARTAASLVRQRDNHAAQADRFSAELDKTRAALTESRTQAATYANEIGRLTANDARQQDDEHAQGSEKVGYEIVARALHRDGLGALRSGDVVASAVSTRPTLAEAVDELRHAIAPAEAVTR